MPASWVQDEDIWSDAEKAFEESYPDGKPDDAKYAIITQIYKNMGGTIRSKSALIRHILSLSRHAIKNNDFQAALHAYALSKLRR